MTQPPSRWAAACRLVLGEAPSCLQAAGSPPPLRPSVLPRCLVRNLGGEEPKVVRGGGGF